MYQLIPLSSPVTKAIEIPGCLSYTTRSLILASLTKNKVKIKKPLKSEDVYSMINCLKEVGIKIEEGEDLFVVENSLKQVDYSEIKFKFTEFGKVNFVCNAGLSGRTARSILPFLCLVPGIKILTADPRFFKRPIGEQVEGLRQLGAKIEYLGEENKLPLKIYENQINKNYAKMKGNVSSQFFAGIMMIAPMIGGVQLDVEGQQVSKSYIDITIDIMSTFGVNVQNQNYQKYIIKPNSTYFLEEYQVEGDYSSAIYFAAIAALTKSEVFLSNLYPESVQGDKEVLNIIAQMGASVEFGNDYVKVKGRHLEPVTVNMENSIDQPPAISVLAAFADGVSCLDGIEILKYKESNRLEAIMNELQKMKIETKTNGQSLKIFGGNPQSAKIEAYNDHRIAMAFSIAGSSLDGMKIKNPEVVGKSFPEFWDKIKELGIEVKEV